MTIATTSLQIGKTFFARHKVVRTAKKNNEIRNKRIIKETPLVLLREEEGNIYVFKTPRGEKSWHLSSLSHLHEHSLRDEYKIRLERKRKSKARHSAQREKIALKEEFLNS